jgi:hypothetical protein
MLKGVKVAMIYRSCGRSSFTLDGESPALVVPRTALIQPDIGYRSLAYRALAGIIGFVGSSSALAWLLT